MGHIGIDPGRAIASPGAIAYIEDDGIAECYYMPQDADALHSILKTLRDKGATTATVEQQWARPTDAPKHAAKLAQNYGEIIGILTGLGIRFTLVSPQKWQRDTWGDRYGSGKSKEISLEDARSMYPYIKMTNKSRDHGKADSLLICNWGIKNSSNR